MASGHPVAGGGVESRFALPAPLRSQDKLAFLPAAKPFSRYATAAAGIRTQSPPAVSDMANRQRAETEPRPYGKGFGERISPNINGGVCGEQKYFKGFSRLKYFCENREEICRASERSE